MLSLSEKIEYTCIKVVNIALTKQANPSAVKKLDKKRKKEKKSFFFFFFFNIHVPVTWSHVCPAFCRGVDTWADTCTSSGISKGVSRCSQIIRSDGQLGEDKLVRLKLMLVDIFVVKLSEANLLTVAREFVRNRKTFVKNKCFWKEPEIRYKRI